MSHTSHQVFWPTTAKPLLQEIMDWIHAMPTDLPLGEHEIKGKNLFANYHEATLIPREQGKFEAHREYIDLHYCLAGGEVIEWAPAETLTPITEYDAAKDYQLYAVPPTTAVKHLVPDEFAIFFPGDAHMPKLSDDQNTTVKKVVIKIHKSLL